MNRCRQLGNRSNCAAGFNLRVEENLKDVLEDEYPGPRGTDAASHVKGEIIIGTV